MYSKEKQQEHISQIRRILVIKPDSTIFEVKEALMRQGKPLSLDKDYINKLVNKITKERAKRIDRYTIGVVLANFQDEVIELKKRLWIIIVNRESSEKDKISAIRELRNSSKDIFDKMFDAGIFNKQLGEIGVGIKVKKLRENLNNLLNDVKADTTNPIPENKKDISPSV